MSNLYKHDSIVIGKPLEIPDAPDIQETRSIKGPMDISVTPDNQETSSPREPADATEIVQSAQQQADAIIAQARQQADLLLQEAQQKSDVLSETAYREAYAKGYEEGDKKGWQQGMDTASATMEEALQMKQKALEVKEKTIRDAEKTIIELVMEIAGKVLGEQVKLDKEAVLGVVRKALDKCPYSSKVTMRVAPEDYDMVVLSKTKLIMEMDGVSDLEISMESTLVPGSCIVETDSGYIDSSVEVQLERIEKYFQELLDYERSKS